MSGVDLILVRIECDVNVMYGGAIVIDSELSTEILQLIYAK